MLRQVIIIAAVSDVLLSSAAFAAPPPDDAKAAITKQVGSVLLDGESARWRWVDYEFGKSRSYCAWVNGKNAYGAYTGFKPFIVTMDKGDKGWFVAPIGIADSDRKAALIAQMCVEQGYVMNSLPDN